MVRDMTRLGCLAAIVIFATKISLASVSFKPVQNVADVGNSPTSVAVADLDGDGKPDLAVSAGFGGSGDQGSIAILLGKGDGTFNFLGHIDSGGTFPTFVALADVNKDGKVDLVVVNCAAEQAFQSCPDETSNGLMAVFLGNGNGSFQTPQTYDTGGSGAGSVIVADVNRDDKLDLIVQNGCGSKNCATTGGFGVLLGNGNGTFQAVVAYPGVGGGSIALADLNTDGKLDLVQVHGIGINVMLGNGDGTFKAPVFYKVAGLNVAAIVTTDLNRDGTFDLVVVSGGLYSGIVEVLMGNGDGSLQTGVTYPSGATVIGSLAAGDVNGDGKPDVVVASCSVKGSGCFPTGGGVVTVLPGKGDGKLQTAVPYNSGGALPKSLAIADLDGDTRSDVITANFFTNDIGILLNDGPYATSTSLVSSLNFSTYGQTVTLSASVTSMGPVMPTGTITFRNGTSSIGTVALIGASTTLTRPYLPAGTLTLTATYNGDTQSGSSKSAAVTQVIYKANSKTAIKSSLNPSALGQAVTFTASVSSPTSSMVKGTITFKNGSTILGTVALSAKKASLTTSALLRGNLTITATYNGTSNIIGSVGSLIQSVK